ncbi:MAG: M2 family metallopeptidase [Bacteroidetes bacterium]|nr:M2 family metallopeptidase [Bacteroidota bacterium]
MNLLQSKINHILLAVLISTLVSCGAGKNGHVQEVQSYLDDYNKKYQELYSASTDGQWAVNTHIVEGDTMNAYKSGLADQALAKFTGSNVNIEKARAYMKWENELQPLQIKQLKKILYMAAGGPESAEKEVKALIKAGTAQTEKLYGYKFQMDGKEITPNDIDSLLSHATDTAIRRKAWEASKAIGKEMKPGLINLRELRNKVVQGLGYPDYFTYMVSDYGMTKDEMMAMLKKFNKELFPLYNELHTYMRYELAKKYHSKEVPDNIPAQWLSNRWGQDWSDMVQVEGLNLDSSLALKDAEWVARQGEKFYVSLGFPALPSVFWEKSSLYPVAKDAGFKKNTHASAWHMDLEKSVRCLMSIVPNSHWYETVHHEYGHIYYYLSYSNPEVPYLLREGANRAYHEALGSMMGLAAMQKPFVAGLGLVDSTTKIDETRQLLKNALHYVVFIPWSTGTMSMFEHDLYANNLPTDQWNKRWWELAKTYQGIVPPTDRSEEFCDAATKTHINDDPAGYYDYAISFILLFQVHDHISKNILHQDPHNTNYFGNKEVGKFIQEIMKPGSSEDWRKLLKDKTGEDLSARAMLDYFSPLMVWLKEENKGRKYTLVEVQ